MTPVATAAASYVALCGLSWLWSWLRAPGFRVANAHVFITGGSSGLGLEIAKIYARAGARVSIVARGQEKLSAAKRVLEAESKHGVFAAPCDVTDPTALPRVVEEANTFHSRVTDHIVACAGISEPGLVADQDASVFRRAMEINYFGALDTLKAALPAMIRNPLSQSEPSRRVVFISTAAALTTYIGYAQYSSSKYAVRGLAESMRNELKVYDIQTSIYYPGNINTDMYHSELRTKPREARLIDSISSPCSVESAAQSLVDGIAKGRFAITNEASIGVCE